MVHDLVSNGRVAVDEEDGVYVDGKKTGKTGFSALTRRGGHVPAAVSQALQGLDVPGHVRRGRFHHKVERAQKRMADYRVETVDSYFPPSYVLVAVPCWS